MKLISLVLALLLLLASCGGSGETSSESNQATPADKEALASESAEISQDDVITSWGLSANSLGLESGESESHACLPGGSAGSLWGTETYTSDSSICTAAVHAGLITLEEGGDVTVTLSEGLESYEASEANGVGSSDWGPYASSFSVS